MHTTSRLSLDVVDGTDNVSGYPVVDAQAKGVLDNAALFLSGTLVNRPAAGTFGRWYMATDDTSSGSAIGTAWFDTGSAWTSAWNPPSRGAVNIATSQSTSSATYTTLGTPDQVTGIVVPANSLVSLWYQATWQESVGGAGRAAIFIGSNQFKVPSDQAAPVIQAAGVQGGAATGTNRSLVSAPFGLVTQEFSTAYTGDVTTGQGLALALDSSTSLYHELNGNVQQTYNIGGGSGGATGGPCTITGLPAGTYTFSVQFKASSGTVTASNRTLRVRTEVFS